jgi:hypothetical protein
MSSFGASQGHIKNDILTLFILFQRENFREKSTARYIQISKLEYVLSFE